MSRTNEAWVADLQQSGPAQEAALADLREILLRNLRKALRHHPRANDEMFEDSVQESLLRILDRLDQFAGRSQFVTWATAIAIRVTLTELRRRSWRDLSLDELMLDAGLPDTPTSQNESDQQTQRTAIVQKMFEVIETQLTPKQKTVLMAELKGMPQVEIVRQLGSNRNAVYKLAHDARRKLKQGLEAAGVGVDDIQVFFAS